MRASNSLSSTFAVAIALAISVGCARVSPPQPAADGDVRVATLAPNLTEIVYAVGAGGMLAGRTDACDYPPECKDVPVIGNFGRAFPEAIAATRTSLLLSVEFEDPSMNEAVERLGVRHECIPCRRLDDIVEAVRRVGELTSHTNEASALASRLEDGIAKLREESGSVPESEKPVVFIEMWDAPLITSCRDSFVSDVIALAGGRNIGDALENKDYSTVSPEWVIERDPDVIICLSGGDDETARKRVSSRVGWSGVSAVKSGRIYAEFDMDAVCRPGPRVLDGIAEVKRLIGKQTP